MKTRCQNPRTQEYPRYGGRGITVCERWQKFDAFFADMGVRPTKNHTLERINNELGYSPDNCRWATWKEQCSNKRNNIMLTWDGRTMAAPVWASLLNLSLSTLRGRIKQGWSDERALTEPVTDRNKGRRASAATRAKMSAAHKGKKYIVRRRNS
jgi:hypothetical protein